MRSHDGCHWTEHTVQASTAAVQKTLHDVYGGDAEQNRQAINVTRIVTTDLPKFFAVVSRVGKDGQEVGDAAAAADTRRLYSQPQPRETQVIGPGGGVVFSTLVPHIQAVFPPGALTKETRIELQVQTITSELVASLCGKGVAVSPIVTIEPRRRKFHKPITLTIPLPEGVARGRASCGDTPALRLLCSIAGGTDPALWEDLTGSTELTSSSTCASLDTSVSAGFWLMRCENASAAAHRANELYSIGISSIQGR